METPTSNVPRIQGRRNAARSTASSCMATIPEIEEPKSCERAAYTSPIKTHYGDKAEAEIESDKFLEFE